MIENELKQIFCKTLKIREDQFHDELAIGDLPEWDSIGHVNLLQAVESQFKIALDVGDAIQIETVGDLMEVVHRYTPNLTS